MKKETPAPNHQLRVLRELRGWSQRYLADQLDAPSSTYISRWERGTATPSPYYREKLCVLFGMDAAELGLLTSGPSERSAAVALASEEMLAPTQEEWEQEEDDKKEVFWNVPYRRNPIFTGREEVLAEILTILEEEHSLVALCGLGGLGKTQTAIEYAYRNRERYTVVIWLSTSSVDTITIDLVTVAEQLRLPGYDQPAKKLAELITRLKIWLEVQKSWLLVLDDVIDIPTIERLLPPTLNGHILLTTRIQATGTLARKLVLSPMSTQEGALFLLRRAKILRKDLTLTHADQENQAIASRITQTMSGHSLALDQIGAYIEETQCPLADYLALYRTNQASLLKRRGMVSTGHPDSVSTTLRFCVENIHAAHPLATDLLYFCAFLHPNAIPQELFQQETMQFCPPLQPLADNPLLLNEMLSVLISYSLISRNTHTKMFSLHSFVQDSLRTMLSQEQQISWANYALQVTNHIFPDNAFEHWYICQRYLPQAQACASLVEQYDLHIPEAVRLLHQTGYFLLEQAQYASAEHLLKKATDIALSLHGNEHLLTADCFGTLAVLYTFLHNYPLAEEYYQRALAIKKLVCGEMHPDTAEIYNNLASLYFYQKEYATAEEMYGFARQIWEQIPDQQNELASVLNNLAKAAQEQNRFSEAEQLLKQALQLWEGALGKTHPNLAFALSNLAQFYLLQQQFEAAEELFLQALQLREQALGTQHPRVGASLRDLASLYRAWQKYALAESFYLRALAIQENVFGDQHAEVQGTVVQLLQLYQDLNMPEQQEHYQHKLQNSRR